MPLATPPHTWHHSLFKVAVVVQVLLAHNRLFAEVLAHVYPVTSL